MNALNFSLNNLFQKTKSGEVLAIIGKNSDLLLPVGLMLAIGTFFISIPTSIISILLILNLAISFIVLGASLYISTPLQLTAYPTILLVTTLFRLCLSVSISRSILEYGSAGEVIEALGKTTAGGNLIVGAVMFSMILVVQFIVIAKGAERVAEVAARFTLDAMPGKQMSIDADLRAGLIAQDQARQMRSELQRESQLYGAMDGAMKFVKGDSIATIIIALINILAGLAVGVLIKGISLSQAAHKYTILTVGDGLAALISSVLVTFSAGIVVTRVTNGEGSGNIGVDIGNQLFGNPRPLMITAGLLFLLALLPGMPWLSLLVISLLVGGIAYLIKRKQEIKLEKAESQINTQNSKTDILHPTFAVPLALVVSDDLTPLIDKNTETGAKFCAELPKLRSAIYYELGVMLPSIHISGNAPLKKSQYFIAVKEVPIVYGTVKKDCVYVNDSAENIKSLGMDGENVRNPFDLSHGAWIPLEQKALAEIAGLKIWEPSEFILLHLSGVLKKYTFEFVGIQETQAYLDFAAQGFPKLVEEVVPKLVNLVQFSEVLQNLVKESVSIRDIKSILEALSEWGGVENDSAQLTECVRRSLRRYLSHKFAGNRNSLSVHLLDPEIEDIIRGAIRRNSNGSYLSLDPNIIRDILEAVRTAFNFGKNPPQKTVIITNVEVRRFFRKVIESEFPEIAVLSFQELSSDLNIQPIGKISMRRVVNPMNNLANVQTPRLQTGGINS